MKRSDTFDEVARLYDEVRPGYMPQLYTDLLAYAKITPPADLLEIGSGTGQATPPLAKKGFNILCLEKGAELAKLAQEKFKMYPNVQIQNSSFEEYNLPENHFDVVFAATSFHWVDPNVKYVKSAKILKKGGTLAVFWNKHITGINAKDDMFFDQVQTIYQQHAPNLLALTNPMHTENSNNDASATGLFADPKSYRYVWAEKYNSDKYIKLLNTYSDHRLLEDNQREKLYQEIKSFIDKEFNGEITKHYETILNVVRKI